MTSNIDSRIGAEIHALARRLWPLNRSLTGNGVRETLGVLKDLLPSLAIHEVASGTEVLDWVVPNEWNVRDAWIETPAGERIANFSANNLHLMGYSVSIDERIPLEELQAHLYSIPEQPTAIPYVTSYYSRSWGFCLAHEQRERLLPGSYHAHIDAELAPGSLTYGELVLPGRSKSEVLLSTYVCHPSMANNELSGVCVQAYLSRWLEGLADRHYTYRIVFVPETIGSITYISRHLEHLRRHVIAGFNITCIGDDRTYSYLPSRAGDTLSDRAALHVLRHLAPDFKRYSYLDRGSDERQYCAPGVDLPIATISRSIYYQYPEYHTSLDDLNFVTPSGLGGGFRALQLAISAIEANVKPCVTIVGEPQLGRRGLYPSVSTKDTIKEVSTMMNLLGYADGTSDMISIADTIGVPVWELQSLYTKLAAAGLIRDARE